MKVVGKIYNLFISVPLILRNISGACLVILVILYLLESSIRKVFGTSFIPVNEVGGLGMLLIVMLSLGWIYQEGGHLRAGFLVDRLPSKQYHILQLFLSILSLVFVCFAGYEWWGMTVSTFRTGRVLYMLRIVEWPFQMAAVLGWGGLAIAIVDHLVREARQVFRVGG